MDPPVLWRAIDIPRAFCVTETPRDKRVTYGGDIRIGDLRNTGQADCLVYRSRDDGSDDGAMKPCFLGAFTTAGEPLWSDGAGGTQPTRPGPVAIHDIDGDGAKEVICFFIDERIEAPDDSMANVTIQVRDGCTGQVKREAAPPAFRACRGRSANWVHQRILLADFRGCGRARDFVVKLGADVLAFDEDLALLWQYTSPWTEYGHCPAYIPAVGDIDGDGRDEVNGGYFLLNHDGRVLWESDWAPHMDSVDITEWDNGRTRAICSGHGLVLDEQGNVILRLGPELVPHGQEVRIARFDDDDPAPQMIIRGQGHSPETLIVGVDGTVRRELTLNPTLNNTGMEVVYWNGPDAAALLCNGGMLWQPIEGRAVPFPGLPEPVPVGRNAWYHAIAANVCGDAAEDLVLYNPWEPRLYVYTRADRAQNTPSGYQPGPRQYNTRLMD